MKFERRTYAPSKTNKYYISTLKGGYNKCVMIDNKTGECIPNCVGYAYGRAMEAWGMKKCSLPTCNAESWINKNIRYKEGLTPKVGSIIVWGKGKVGKAADGAGHVEFVEKVNVDGSIETTGSAAGGTRWFTRKYKKGYKKSGYDFLGFIYPPVEFGERYQGIFPKLPSRGYFKKGDKGVQVKHLQELLNWSVGTKLKEDGILGDATVDAVKRFQKEYSLKTDGLFGNNCLSRSKLIEK